MVHAALLLPPRAASTDLGAPGQQGWVGKGISVGAVQGHPNL